MTVVMARDKSYKRLLVWQEAHRFALLAYRCSERFPKSELFGLTSQLRRAALSVPTNIVEGQASNSKKEFRNFLNIARRSLAESEYLLEFARELEYLLEASYDEVERQREKVGFLLHRLFITL